MDGTIPQGTISNETIIDTVSFPMLLWMAAQKSCSFLLSKTSRMSRRMFQSVVENLRPYLQKSNRFVYYSLIHALGGVATGIRPLSGRRYSKSNGFQYTIFRSRTPLLGEKSDSKKSPV
jgi:hypothetical protein